MDSKEHSGTGTGTVQEHYRFLKEDLTRTKRNINNSMNLISALGYLCDKADAELVRESPPDDTFFIGLGVAFNIAASALLDAETVLSEVGTV